MKRLLAVLGWLAVAAATIAISTWAISLLGEGLSQHVVTPLSEQQVDQALAGATATPATSFTPSPAGTRTPSATKAFATRGGSVVAGCAGDQAMLRSWSPAQGYATDDVDKGPGSAASLEFKADSDRLQVRITCRDGLPTISIGPGGD
jgi:hypothetical protein